MEEASPEKKPAMEEEALHLLLVGEALARRWLRRSPEEKNPARHGGKWLGKGKDVA